MNDDTEDTGDKASVKKRADSVKRRRARELAEVRAILALREGRALLWRVLSEAKMYSTSYTGDKEGTFFNEGKRVVGLFVLGEIAEADPAAYGRMMAENQEGK